MACPGCSMIFSPLLSLLIFKRKEKKKERKKEKENIKNT